MVLAIPLLLVALQTTTPRIITRPASLNNQVHAISDAIETAMVAPDWAKAERLLTLFPKEEVTYQWDDSKVPQGLRDLYAESRDRAMNMWQARYHHIKLQPGSNPDIKFSFEPKLAPNGTNGLPLGVATFSSMDTTATRLEAVIGLARGKELTPANEMDVQNEVAYVVGTYLGLAPGPAFGPSMGRTDLSTKYRTEVTASECFTALAVSRLRDLYKQAIQDRKPVKTELPTLFADPQLLDLGSVLQGAVIPTTVQITNTGKGILAYSMAPDCGCIKVSVAGELQPGATTLLHADFDSSNFIGEHEKRIFILTNDPRTPIVTIPVKIHVQASYRFLRPEGNVLVLNGRRGSADVYLVLPDHSDIIPTDYHIDGVNGVAVAEDWTGTLADPELDEGPKPRAGFKVKMTFDDQLAPGRSSATLVVKTSNPKFDTIRYNIYIQKGIAALPFSVFLGEMTTTPKKSTLLVSRPGKSFKILGIESSSASLTTSFEPNKAKDEYKVTVNYDGKASGGEFMETLTVKTDDPTQPKIEVPVRGSVG